MKLRKWLIYKLGGYFLDDEERKFLTPLWIERMKKQSERTLNKKACERLYNGFNTDYTKD